MQVVIDQAERRLRKREVARAHDADDALARLLGNPRLAPDRNIIHSGAGAGIGKKNGAFAGASEAIRHDSPGLLLPTTRPWTCRNWV